LGVAPCGGVGGGLGAFITPFGEARKACAKTTSTAVSVFHLNIFGISG